jgi:cell division protein FtsB
MRIFVTLLGVALMMLQYRLWISDQGTRDVSRLQAALAAQGAANHDQGERNRQLAAEVTNLKGGMAALEERARSELGMVGSSETFYQIVTPSTPAPAAPPKPVTARTQ